MEEFSKDVGNTLNYCTSEYCIADNFHWVLIFVIFVVF